MSERYIKVSGIKLNRLSGEDEVKKAACRIAGIETLDVTSFELLKESIDARDKDDIKVIYSAGFMTSKKVKKGRNITILDRKPCYKLPSKGNLPLTRKPVVIGFGPAGMLCSYMLAKAGFSPVIIERGMKAKERKRIVEEFWESGKLNPNTNVQFGEGGAGTFSDGKLNTGVKDKACRIDYILDLFVKMGADSSIKYSSKPHIGTDVLVDMVFDLRKEIERLGGTFLFEHTFTGFESKDGSIKKVTVKNNNDNTETVLETDVLILATGHSARDTYRMLFESGVYGECKPFAVGFRAEHPQSVINRAMYGDRENDFGASPYKVTYKAEDGRGVYSFCMCPGGYVVNSSSEDGRLVVNGMSYHDRGSKNANSAIVVTINPDDYTDNKDDILSGVRFQEEIEKRAFDLGGGYIPKQSLKSFKESVNTKSYKEEVKERVSSVKGKSKFCDITGVLPDYINKDIAKAFEHFDKIIKGFGADDTMLYAVESRTSSPVRIKRDDKMNCNVKGIIPVGEGAGYAGGITSAAIDGMKAFEQIYETYKPVY